MAQSFVKDPNAVLDYSVNWSAWLGADTIATSTWTVAGGITQDSANNSTTAATIWLSGGTVGTPATAQNRIVTTGGRTEDRTLKYRIKER